MASDDSHSDSDSNSGSDTSESRIKNTLLSTESSSLHAPKYVNGHVPLTPRTFIHSLTYRHAVLILLPIFSMLGFYGTMALGSANGLFPSIVALLEDPDALFPGTDELLIRSYTGIGFIDSQLALLVAFFAPLLDIGPDREGLYLFGIFGMGQFGSVWCLMMMESLRIGNKGRLLTWVGVVGVIFQNISYTVTTPLWLLLHLLTSPVAKPFPGTHANSVLLIQPWDLRILPISITLSYLVPSVMMGLPSPEVLSPEEHQYWIAIWQAFPVWTVIIHYSLRTAVQTIVNKFSKEDVKTRAAQPQGASYLSNAKFVYIFVLGFCMITHIPVLLVALLPSFIFSSFSPLLSKLGQETISSVYIPYFPTLSYELSGFSQGVHTFLQWDVYIGSTAFLFWAVLLYRNATTEKTIVDPSNSLPVYRELLAGETGKSGGNESMTRRKLLMKIMGWSVASGPIGALAVLLWERDAIVRQKIKQGI